MGEEKDNKLENILVQIKTNRNASTTTNPRYETKDMQNSLPSESKTGRSIGVHASNTKSSDSEDEGCPLRPSRMKNLRHPAKPLYRNELDLDATVVSNKDSEEEDYHSSLLRDSRYSALKRLINLELFLSETSNLRTFSRLM